MALHRRLIDYHVHSTESCDGKSSILEMCQKATSLGMVDIGFSDHVDFDSSDQGYGFFNYDRYTAEITKARRLFENRLIIREGVEVDYQKRFEEKIREWLQDKQFDFIIGSVHYIEGRIIDHNLISNIDAHKLYITYFSEIIRSVESRLFDVVGHLDYISKYDSNIRQMSYDYCEKIQTILEKIIEREMHLEINTKMFALNQKSAETIPNMKVVTDYIRKGGKLVSVGSDAHTPTEMGCGINETLNYLDRYKEKQIKLLF